MGGCRRVGVALVVAAGVVAGAGSVARAADKDYVGPASGANARWNVSTNWSPAGLPGGGDVVRFIHADAVARDVAVDVSASVNMLLVGNSGLGTTTLTHVAAGDLNVNIGHLGLDEGAKAVYAQSGGTARFGTLDIASGTASNATFNLSGGALIGAAGSSFTVGNVGTGTFNHTGGTVTLGEVVGGEMNGGGLSVGFNPGATGTYTLSGASASLAVYRSLYVGLGGAGTFTHSTGAVSVGSAAEAHPLYLAVSSGSQGTYALGGAGIVTAHGPIIVGGGDAIAGGTGVFDINGGTLTAPSIKVWNSPNSAVNFSAGTLTVGSIDTSGQPNRFNWTGGTLNVTGAGGLSVGNGGPVGAALDLTSGRTLNVTNTLTIPATGVVNVQSGTLSAGVVSLSGTLTGAGNVLAPVSTSGAATIAPGNGGGGTLSVAGLTLNTSARLVVDPGDRIAVTFPNALNIAGTTDVVLTGQSTTGPLITYEGVLGGSVNNLRLSVGGTGSEYRVRHNAANHSVDLVARRLGTVAQVARTGEPAPGNGGGTINFPRAGAIDANGVLALASDITGAADGSGGLFRMEGGVLTAVLRGNQPAPGSDGGTFSSFQAPSFNEAGQMAFEASLAGTDNLYNVGLFRTDGTTTVQLARKNRAAGGMPMRAFDNPVINAAGHVAFWAESVNGGQEGVFRGDGNSTIAIARTGLAAPGAGTFTDNFESSHSINDAGQVAFTATYSGPSGSRGIFRSDAAGTALTLIARGEQPAPGGGTFSNSVFSGPQSLNSSGQVAFGAMLLGNTHGIFRGDGAGPAIPIARDDQTAPGAGGGKFSGGMAFVALNDSGQVAFTAGLAATTNGSTHGLFRGDGANPLVAIARHNLLAPGPGGGTFNADRFNTVVILPGGQVAFEAYQLLGTAGGTGDNEALYLGDGQELLTVVRKGQLLNGTPITDVYMGGHESVNQFGQVAYGAVLGPGASAQVLFTPVLHWRAATGGSWDANANWTVGLAPAHVHEVVIDPATALTVTGPATPRTIKSLAIGDNAGGPAATLQLTNPNAALKTSALAVDGAGGSKLDLKDGKLVVTGGDTAAVRGLILSGYHGGAWDGGGIVTTAAGGGSAVGYARAEDVGLAGGVFGGVAVTAGDVLLVSTLAGDATLDRVVDFNDLVRLAQNYNVTDGSRTWSTGDFTYDGHTDFNDLVRLAQNYNAALPSEPIHGATGGFDADFARAMAQVPEPRSVTGLIAGVACLWTGRKSRQSRR